MEYIFRTIEQMHGWVYEAPVLGIIPIGKLILALGIVIGLNAVFWILRKIILVYLKNLSTKTITSFDDMLIAAVSGVRAWVYTIVSIHAALIIFSLPNWLDVTTTAIFLFALVWQGIEVAVTVVDYLTNKYVAVSAEGDAQAEANLGTIAELIRLMVRIGLWVLGSLFVLANLGINVTSLIAGLGIGGIAIAFALQGVLSDLFASFSIYLDRPFRIGDYIVIGTDSGTVEKIGIKSTRLRTLQGEELVVANAELTSARVQNFKKMDERRIVATIGITYETPYKLVENVPSVITEAFEAFDGGRLDRVYFTSFGDSALVFEIVYFIESPEMKDFLEVQQRFNLMLLKAFTEKGIEFAYPTQTIYSK